MDPWTGRALAQARIDALLAEAATERLAATARRAHQGTAFVADPDQAHSRPWAGRTRPRRLKHGLPLLALAAAVALGVVGMSDPP